MSTEFIPIPTQDNPLTRFLQETLYRLNTKWEVERDKDFELIQTLTNITAPVIEVGGPTELGYRRLLNNFSINALPSGQRIIVSDIVRRDNSDLVCDGGRLPFANNSIGALLFSCLPKSGESVYHDSPRSGTITEASRVLIPGGLLLAQAISEDNINHARELGLEPKIIYTATARVPSLSNWTKIYDVVMQKGE